MDWTRVYEDIVDFAGSTPGWLHTLAEVGTDAGLFVFAALFVVVAVRAWRAPARELALAVSGPAGIVLAYILSEVIKTFVQEDRPCRGGIATIAACPPLDDWSFPSNHSVIAAGAAATLVLAWRSLAWAVFPLAVVMAFSRVFVGVHYPHDVAAGFLLGATLAPLFALLLVGAVTPAVRLLRARLPEHLRPAAPDPAPNWRQRPSTSQPPFEDPQLSFGQGPDPRQHVGADPRQHVGADPRQHVGVDPRQDFGPDPRQDPSVDPRYGPAADPGRPSFGRGRAPQHGVAQPPHQYAEGAPQGYAGGAPHRYTDGPPHGYAGERSRRHAEGP